MLTWSRPTFHEHRIGQVHPILRLHRPTITRAAGRILLALFLLPPWAPLGRSAQAGYDIACSAQALIDAIEETNASVGDDVLNLAPGCVYILTAASSPTLGGNGLPDIPDAAVSGSLTVHGNGATLMRGNILLWLPFVNRGATANSADQPGFEAGAIPASVGNVPPFRLWLVGDGGHLTLDDVTLQNGLLPDQNGGGLYNAGTLTVTHSSLTNHSAVYGGALYSTGNLTVSDSTFAGNSADLGDALLVAEGAVTESNNAFLDDAAVTCPVFPHTVPAGDVARLIRAIQCANGSARDNTIELTNSTYSLSTIDNVDLGPSGLPAIRDSALAGKLTIAGNGATIERNNGSGIPDFRIFLVSSGGNLTLRGVTLRNGKLPYDELGNGSLGNFNGGAIYTAGTLWLDGSTVSSNTSIFGGGVVNQGGTLTVTSSTFLNNTVTRDGAGINSFGALVVSTSTFSGNVAQGLAGGIIAQGTAAITNSTFSGNTAFSEFAGGAGILTVFSTLTLSGCTFSANHTPGAGGGLFIGGNSSAVIDHSTFANNTAGVGGGIWSGGTVTVTHSTLSANAASTSFAGGGGGGIAITNGTLSLGNTLVAGNSAPLGPDLSGVVHSLGFNLIGTTSAATLLGTATGNLLDSAAAPLDLGALQNNGGPTLTMALGPTSVAINSGDPAFVPPPNFDQRGLGFARVIGGRIDIGAYER